jgi:predicted DNA-binding helix-hairpin-helix protein
MFYTIPMETLVKLREIAVHMDLEPAEEVGPTGRGATIAPCGQVVDAPASGAPTSRRAADKRAALGVTHAALPNGRTIPLLKTLLTTACERNCTYCPFRAGRDGRRVSFTPDEMAGAFMTMQRAGLVEGLFLSSGIIGGGARTQDKLLDTIDILRSKHKWRGYVHLKVMPGAERDQVRRAMQLADRLSVNLEGANPDRLSVLAPMKQFVDELLTPLRWIEEIRQSELPGTAWNGRWPSSTTQFVVGAVGESDLELLSITEYLVHQVRLRRAYFSAFRPVANTPLAHLPAENPLRQHRLYQASYLFRDYGFDLEEMPFTADGRLPLDKDPKLLWAEATLQDAPVELNRAAREELLRVPGIGPKSAATILNARRRGPLRTVHDLQLLGVSTRRLRPFVLLDGHRPEFQLPLL